MLTDLILFEKIFKEANCHSRNKRKIPESIQLISIPSRQSLIPICRKAARSAIPNPYNNGNKSVTK